MQNRKSLLLPESKTQEDKKDQYTAPTESLLRTLLPKQGQEEEEEDPALVVAEDLEEEVDKVDKVEWREESIDRRVSNRNPIHSPYNDPDILQNMQKLTKDNSSAGQGLLIQYLLGVLGLGAFVLYLNPSDHCASDSKCGQWLTDLTSHEIARDILLGCGASDYAFLSAYFAFYTIPHLLTFLREQNTLSKKLLMGAAVTALSALGNAMPFLISRGYKDPIWVTTVSSLGAYPNSLYTAVSIIKNDIPYIINAFKCSPHQASVSRLKARAKANWSSILAEKKASCEFSIGLDQSPLNYLMNEREVILEKSSACNTILHSTFTGLGVATAAGMWVPLMLNGHRVIEENWFPGQEQWAIPISIASGALTSYLITKVTVAGFNGFYKGLYNLTHNKPIEWLAFQVKPRTTIVVEMGCLLTALLSYATLVSVYNESYNGSYKDELRLGVYLGIVSFHFSGLTHLYDLLFDRLISDPTAKFLISVEKELQLLLNASDQTILDCHCYNHYLEKEQKISIEKSKEEALEEIIGDETMQQVSSLGSIQHPVRRKSWCEWFQSKPSELSFALLEEKPSSSKCVML